MGAPLNESERRRNINPGVSSRRFMAPGPPRISLRGAGARPRHGGIKNDCLQEKALVPSVPMPDGPRIKSVRKYRPGAQPKSGPASRIASVANRPASRL